MEVKREGILPAQIDAVKSLTNSIEKNGAKASCVIAFGSRASEQGKTDSDLDVFFLLDFGSGDVTLLSDETLRQTKYLGQSTTEKQGPAGEIHLFLYNIEGFFEKLLAYPDLNKSHLFAGIAKNGVVIQGEEPLVEDKPLREYIKSRLEK